MRGRGGGGNACGGEGGHMRGRGGGGNACDGEGTCKNDDRGGREERSAVEAVHARRRRVRERKERTTARS